MCIEVITTVKLLNISSSHSYHLCMCVCVIRVHNLRKENGVGSFIFPDFKLYYKVIIFKIVWHWHKNRQID